MAVIGGRTRSNHESHSESGNAGTCGNAEDWVS